MSSSPAVRAPCIYSPGCLLHYLCEYLLKRASGVHKNQTVIYGEQQAPFKGQAWEILNGSPDPVSPSASFPLSK
ncbi:hypothetical protein Y1Q_0003222 [Alligator mississippiensis]|uniref:Uncharacterized protein n=1 Tax=Alligator mississippiensis TaxID=8496 RepID=A0A151ME02_ALLMI|nr:hypothetical protein Y1Q_0003222 [Alligator mississippiensis]